MVYTHVAAALLAAAVTGAGTWQIQNWRYGIQIAELKKQQAEAVAKAELTARTKEQALVAARTQAEKRYVDEKRKAAVAAAGAGSELDRLRDALAKRERELASADTAASDRVNGGARLESELLGHCAQALVGLAAEADGLEARIVGLQSYVKQVCLKR